MPHYRILSDIESFYTMFVHIWNRLKHSDDGKYSNLLLSFFCAISGRQD